MANVPIPCPNNGRCRIIWSVVSYQPMRCAHELVVMSFVEVSSVRNAAYPPRMPTKSSKSTLAACLRMNARKLSFYAITANRPSAQAAQSHDPRVWLISKAIPEQTKTMPHHTPRRPFRIASIQQAAISGSSSA